MGMVISGVYTWPGGPPSDEDIETQLRRYAIWYSHGQLVDVVGSAIENAHQDVDEHRCELHSNG